MMRVTGLALLLAASFALAGCSGGSADRVKGKVVLEDEPLSGALLEFAPVEDINLRTLSARTDADGKFEIQPEGGLQPGRYMVLITKPANGPPEAGEQQAAMPGVGAPPGLPANALPAKYSDRKNPTFVIELTKGTNDLDPFVLQRDRPKSRKGR